jgi:hypothetical protein
VIRGAAPGADDPTWVMRLSGVDLLFEDVVAEVSKALAPYLHGADITTGFGVWHGQIEASVQITIQAAEFMVARVLERIAEAFPDLHYVHVEQHRPSVVYVDLGAYRPVEAVL